jgi:hypothetical protein
MDEYSTSPSQSSEAPSAVAFPRTGVGEVARWTGRRDRWRRIWLLGFFTRIVRRINEGHLERPGIEKLEDRLLVGCEDPMSVIGRHY